jgi:hypothetical protein
MGTVYEYRNWNTGGTNDYDTAILIHKAYGGNDLGTVSADNIDSFIEEHEIATGKFTDLYVGDYFTASYSGNSTTFRVIDISPYYNMSESGIAGKHHILIVPDSILTSSYMNYSATNSTGYKGSNMYTSTISKVNSNLKDIFGNHLLSHNEIVSTSNGAATNTVSVTSILLNNIEIFGSKKYANYTSGLLNYQLPGFKNFGLIKCRETYLTRDCSSSGLFCTVESSGDASSITSSYSEGVRPRFLLG